MTIRFYLLPIIRPLGTRVPKYFYSLRYNPDGVIHSNYSIKDYGSIDMCVLASDISDANHVTLSAFPDVYSFPVNLDETMTTAQRTALNAYMEANAIPGDWIKTGDAFRATLRTITAMFLYMQRVLALLDYLSNPFAGLTLNTQYRNIPNPLHDALSQASAQLGYAWNVSGTDQARRIFKIMADQFGSRPIYFGFVTL
jgi:hypothetical protein